MDLLTAPELPLVDHRCHGVVTAELAPFTRLLYSSDAYGAPELYVLGAR